MGAAKSAPDAGGRDEDKWKDAVDDNASFCSSADGQPDVGRVDSMQSLPGDSPIMKPDAGQPMCSFPSDATGETCATGAESSATSSFEMRLARTDGAAWGFAWNVGAYAAKRLLVAGVDPASPAGRWSSDARERSARAIERGDELVSVNGITENGSMRRELVAADEVHLVFTPAAEGGLDNRRLKLGPNRRPAPIAPPTPPPQAVPSSDSNLRRDAPVCIKNTFLHVSEKEEHGEDEFSRSDPFPISQLGGAWKHSPYTPGCLAGVNLPAHIAKMAQSAGGEVLDRSGSSYSGWSTAQSKSSSNSMSGDERGPPRGADRHWPSTSSESEFPSSPHIGSMSFSGSRPLYPTAEVASPASTSSSVVSPAKVVGNVAASVEAAAASPTHHAPALTHDLAGEGVPGDEATRTASLSTSLSSLSSPPKAPAMKIKNTFIEIEEPEETEFDFNDTCKTAPVFNTPGLLATPISQTVNVLASLNESIAKGNATDAACPEVAVDASRETKVSDTGPPSEATRLSVECLERNPLLKAREAAGVASQLEPARASPGLRDWEGVPKAAMMIKNTFVEFAPQDDQDSEFGDTLKTMPDLWRPGLLASPMAGPSMNLLTAATAEDDEEPTIDIHRASAEKPIAGVHLTQVSSASTAIQRPQEMEEHQEQAASADEDGEDAEHDSAGNPEGAEGEVAPKRRKPTRRAGRRARHRRHHAAEARRLAEEAAAEAAAAGVTDECVGNTVAERSGVASKEAGPAGHVASQSRQEKESVAETGQSPTRRGGRPPKKSQLAAAAAKSLSGVAATPDTNGLGLGGDATASAASFTPTSSPSRAAPIAASGASPQDSDMAAGANEQDQLKDGAADDLLGKRVLIQGLVRQPQFNGEWGKVESYDPKLQRFAVRILQDAGLGVLAKLRRDNLVVPQTLSLKFNDEARAFVPEQRPPALDAAASPTASADASFVPSVAQAALVCSTSPPPVLQLDELVNTGTWTGSPELDSEALAAGAASVEKWRPTLRPLSS